MTSDPGTRHGPGPTGGPATSTASTGLTTQRIGRPERDRVLTLLSEALSGEYLTLTEFEELTERTALARNQAELDAITRELSPQVLRKLGQGERRARLSRAAMLGVRIHVRIYLAVSLFLVILWLIIGMSSGAWYPWPIWPIMGWGLGVLGHAIPVTMVVRSRAAAAGKRPA